MVTSYVLRGERLYQFEMFAIKQLVVINPWIFSPVASQPALPCQTVCTPILWVISRVTTKYEVDRNTRS